MSLGMLGKYERLDILGHGASGIVYLAQDTLLRRRVALKEITAQGEDKQRVLEEARVLDRLRHPNIVAVHGVDTINGKVVIDMEYVQGSNLLDIMRYAGGAIPVNISLSIATQICDGLSYAHAQRTIHRDIKPANILVSTDYHVKLADFGLAQVLGTNSYAGGAGTFAYMAPEDFEEGDKSDHQSDLWAIGVILYEMLTGRRPFTVTNARDPFAWSRAVSRDDVPNPSSFVPAIEKEVDRICLKALQRRKIDRYQSAGEMADDLRRLSDGKSITEQLAFPIEAELSQENTQTPIAQALVGTSDIDGFLSHAPSQWDESCEALESGELARWLVAIGEPLLSRVAAELSRDDDTNIQSRMRDFLYRAGVELEKSARDDARQGSEYYAERNYPEAVESFQRSVNLDPSQPNYFRLLAQAARSNGDVEFARETLNSGLRVHPQDRGLKKDVSQIGGALPSISKSYVNFGQLRHGETRTLTVELRAIGNDAVKGRVASSPGWLKVTPLSFNSRLRQVIKLTAESGTLPREPQEYEESVVFDTSAGLIDLPVSVTLLKNRPLFASILYWYVPVFAFCTLPALIAQLVAMRSHLNGSDQQLSPAGLIASGTFFCSFVAINAVTDTRWRERAASIVGALLLPAGILYFLSLLQSAPHYLTHEMPLVIECSLAAIAVPLIQALTLLKYRDNFAHWPIWCGVIIVMSSLVSIVLWEGGVPGVQ